MHLQSSLYNKAQQNSATKIIRDGISEDLNMTGYDDSQASGLYVCEKCGKKYCSATGLYYHRRRFDHANPPPDYDPNVTLKRGRPRGSGARRQSGLDDSDSDLNLKDKYIHRSARRITLASSKLNKDSSDGVIFIDPPRNRKLTYAEAQQLVELEQNNIYYRVHIDENIEVVKEERQESIPPHNALSAYRNGAAKRVSVLQEAIFCVKEEYQQILTQGESFLNKYVYHHPPFTALSKPDNCVEYEMDEEDVAWLDLVNTQRQNMYDSSMPSNGLSNIKERDSVNVPPSTFEFIMDRLEKESAFILKSTDGTDTVRGDDDVVCAICLDGDCSNINLIVFCDICNTPVHQDCYGLPYVPEGQWLCRRCRNVPSKEISCVLCPLRTGVFKQTSDGKWCHIICALLMPGAKFINPVFLEPIDVSDVSHTRFNVKCKICNLAEGAVFQCIHSHCTVPFHISCAQKAGWLFLERCEIPPNIDEESVTHINHKFLCYCPKHYPIHKNPAIPSRDFAALMQKDVMDTTSHTAPTIHVPVVPDSTISILIAKYPIWENQTFINKVKRYWQLKRYLRCGVPLLRSLVSRTHIPSLNLNTNDNNLLITNEDHEKMNDVHNSLGSTLEILTKINEREKLKLKKVEISQTINKSILSPEHMFPTLIKDMNKYGRMSQKTFEISVLIKLYYEHFNMDYLANYESFLSFLTTIFESYCKLNNVSQKEFMRISHDLRNITGKSITRSKNFDGYSISLESLCLTDTIINSPDVDLLPYVELLVKNLADNDSSISKSTRLSLNHIDKRLKIEIEDIEISKIAVWAEIENGTVYPARIVNSRLVTSSKRNCKLSSIYQKHEKGSVLIEYFTKVKSFKWINISKLSKLGFSATIDRKYLSDILNSFSMNSSEKLQFIEAYISARMFHTVSSSQELPLEDKSVNRRVKDDSFIN